MSFCDHFLFFLSYYSFWLDPLSEVVLLAWVVMTICLLMCSLLKKKKRKISTSNAPNLPNGLWQLLLLQLMLHNYNAYDKETLFVGVLATARTIYNFTWNSSRTGQNRHNEENQFEHTYVMSVAIWCPTNEFYHKGHHRPLICLVLFSWFWKLEKRVVDF